MAATPPLGLALRGGKSCRDKQYGQEKETLTELGEAQPERAQVFSQGNEKKQRQVHSKAESN
jgi:hypothetical protein